MCEWEQPSQLFGVNGDREQPSKTFGC